MTSARCSIAAVATFFALFCCLARSSGGQASCPGPPPLRETAEGNIFNEQQEMDLGDAIAEQFEHNFNVVQNQQLNSYLNEIAQRLLARMPLTHLKFRIVLVDVPVPDAFTMPGGRIYVTRKLVTFAKSEDELAGVLGHELGHALSHQPAANVSRLFREVLGVTQVGDRKDIFLKYNELIENVASKNLHFNRDEDQREQQVADSYALYAMARAGYAPDAMVNFWKRSAQTRGKTGNWLRDLFSVATPNEHRLRQMQQYTANMPPACIVPEVTPRAGEFLAWQQAVIAYAVTSPGEESLPGLLWKRQLSPPLEGEITNVKFSPDGKYLLAQDDFSVYVLSRDPLKQLFRIPVDDAEPAGFTPDSQSVLIWTGGLHVERWSVISLRRVDVHEVVTQKPCLQADLSPDGDMVACVQAEQADDLQLQFDFSLLDVGTGATVILKRHFYEASAYRSGMNDFTGLLYLIVRHMRFFNMHFSPDGRYFAISRNSTAFAWDLKTRSPVKLAGAVKDLMSGEFTFDGPDRIVGYNIFAPRNSGSARFPSGPASTRIEFYQQALSAPTRADAVLVQPAGNFAMGLIDLKTGKGLLGTQMTALDVYENVYARPRPDGSIGIYDLNTRQELAATTFPKQWIGQVPAAQVSSDLKWFAASGTARGAVWNLATGDRIFHVRGFGTCEFSSQDNLYVSFSHYLKEKRSIGVLNPFNNTIRQGAKLDDDVQTAQLGMYLLYVRREKQKWNGPLVLEVHDVATNATLWVKRYFRVSPQVSISPDSDEMTLVLPFDSADAKEEEKQNKSLLAESSKISSKDTARLIQVVNAQDGKLRAEFAVDTGKGSFSIRQALPAGKWVVVVDNENRALIYSLDGKLVGRLFGARPTVSSSGGAIALESQTGTLAIYDLATLVKREELTFGVPLAFYQLVDHGSRLFAVSENQTAYLLSLDQRGAK